MRLGVFVGSFNPVHKGHIEIANYILNKNYVDKVLMIPTPNYWDKKDLVDTKYRIKMLKFYENDRLVVEEKTTNLPYTYQVIDELKKIYPKDELCLIMGADNIISFDKWNHYEDLLKLEFIIFTRDNIDIRSYLDKLNKKDKYIVIDSVEGIQISSSLVRENINNKRLLKKYLDKDVIKYIEDNKLYRM